MTEIDRERGQQRLHIDPVPIPLADPLDREPMAQRLQAWTTPSPPGLGSMLSRLHSATNQFPSALWLSMCPCSETNTTSDNAS